MDERTKAIQLVDKPEDMTIMEIMDKINETCLTTPSDRVTFASAATHKDKMTSPSSQHQHSFTSTSSCRSSSIPQDPSENSGSLRQTFSANEASKLTDEESKRIRYRSGPPLSTHLPCPPMEPIETLEYPGPRRERAFSLHSNLESGPPKRPSRPSFSAHTREERVANAGPRERTETWTTVGSEKYRKRNISMPSKCHKEMGSKTIHSKCLSAEAMKENEAQTPIFQDANSTLLSSATDSSQQTAPSHIPLYGSATLPVYCFDCRLGSFVNQFLNP